jgi:hypothetical protein
MLLSSGEAGAAGPGPGEGRGRYDCRHHAEGEGDGHGSFSLGAGSHDHRVGVTQGIAPAGVQEPPLQDAAVTEHQQDMLPPAGPEIGGHEPASRLLACRLSK